MFGKLINKNCIVALKCHLLLPSYYVPIENVTIYKLHMYAKKIKLLNMFMSYHLMIYSIIIDKSF